MLSIRGDPRLGLVLNNGLNYDDFKLGLILGYTKLERF
jgi:hypothetical protein